MSRTFITLTLLATALLMPAHSEAKQSNPQYTDRIVELPADAVAETIAQLEEQGVIVLRHRDNLALCLIPQDTAADEAAATGSHDDGTDGKGGEMAHKLRKIIGSHDLREAFPRPRIQPAMDKARTFFDADNIYLGQGLPSAYTGKGVVVGFTDIGFDPSHVTFLNSSATESRVKRVVQYIESEGRRIQCDTPEEIAAWRTDNDDEFHATHVAGILAGGYEANGFRGCAPEATIVATTSECTDVGILAGVEDIIEYAQSVDAPAVVNISMGYYLGPHDGTSLFCRYLDKCADDAIICLSSGNEGTSRNTISHIFSTETPAIAFPVTSLTNANFDIEGASDIWMADATPCTTEAIIFDAAKSMSETIVREIDFSENARWLLTSYPEDTSLATENEDLKIVYDEEFAAIFSGRIIFSAEVNPVNGRYHVEMQYSLHSDIKPPSGANWGRYLPGARFSGPDGIRIDAYTDGIVSSMHNPPAKYAARPGSSQSVSDLCTGQYVISVGQYVNRTPVTMFGGGQWSDSNEPGITSDYSGYGNLVDGRIMPLTVAPGTPVISSISTPFLRKNQDWVQYMSYISDGSGLEPAEPRKPLDNFTYEEGAYYWAPFGGTSMSSPYVAGQIATWLQANPDMNISDIRGIIRKTNHTEGDHSYISDPRNGEGIFRPYAGIIEALSTYTGKVYDTKRDSSVLRVEGTLLYIGTAEEQTLRICSSDGSLLLQRIVSPEDVGQPVDLSRFDCRLIIATLADGTSAKIILNKIPLR